VTGHLSVMLYLRTKDLTPRKYESVYEISYLLTGKAGIAVVIGIQIAVTLGGMILYYMVLGDIIGALIGQS